MSMSPIDVAKAYLADNKQYKYMEDGNYTVTDHDSAMDNHTAKLLGGVAESDVHNNQYHVVTVQKEVLVENHAGYSNTLIPKIIKIQVSKVDNSILSVLESK